MCSGRSPFVILWHNRDIPTYLLWIHRRFFGGLLNRYTLVQDLSHSERRLEELDVFRRAMNDTQRIGNAGMFTVCKCPMCWLFIVSLRLH